jgi:membrane-bound acyltransferase YfiQ involved in biofilm formation
VLNAIFLLELFRDISVKGALFKRIVLSLSGAAFGVYIIHAHILVLDFVLTDAFAALGRQNIMVCFLGILASLFGIYLICWVVDLLRGGLFKLMQIDKLSNVLGRRLNTLLKWNDTTEK